MRFDCGYVRAGGGKNHPAPRRVWVFLIVFCLFGAVATALTIWSTWQQAHAVETTAELVSVNEVRNLAQVRFTDDSHATCVGQISYDAAKHGMRIGDQIQVRYTRQASCGNVRAADDNTWWVPVLVPTVLLLAGLTIVVVLRRRAARWRRQQGDSTAEDERGSSATEGAA